MDLIFFENFKGLFSFFQKKNRFFFSNGKSLKNIQLKFHDDRRILRKVIVILRSAHRTQYLPEYYARWAISLSLTAPMFDISLREEESKEIDKLEETEGILCGPGIAD